MPPPVCLSHLQEIQSSSLLPPSEKTSVVLFTVQVSEIKQTLNNINSDNFALGKQYLKLLETVPFMLTSVTYTVLSSAYMHRAHYYYYFICITVAPESANQD